MVDNLSAHKGAGVREVIEERGCQLLFVPPYSPDFNPIEEAFSKIKKGALRKVGARSREALIEALGVAISALSAKDARGFFEHMVVTIYPSIFYETRCRRQPLPHLRVTP